MINSCPSLQELIINDNNLLTKVTITESPNILKIDLSNCRSIAFAKYDESNPDNTALNALDLSGCRKLEELNLTNCTA
ncbi:hypothetical protein [Intestinibacter sp.]|uniref:hypothetical protein n=1 Tax=Intestinibacter sp. TaxID=1965304 RepID=UPI003F165D98